MAMLRAIPPLPRKNEIFIPICNWKSDFDTYIQNFVSICQANQEGTNVEKLRLFWQA